MKVLINHISKLEFLNETRNEMVVTITIQQWNMILLQQNPYCSKSFKLGDYILWFPKGCKEYLRKFKWRWFGRHHVQYFLPDNK
jgi:hypothetical protein